MDLFRFISHIHSDMFHFLLYGCFRPAIPPQFPDLTCADGAVDDGIPVLSFVPPRNGTKLDSRVLEFCYPKARKVAEIAEYLGVKDSTYLRKKVLGNLEQQGYLDKSKVSRAVYYKTLPDMVRKD